MCNCKNKEFKDAVFFAKVRPDAVIPSKRDEDAGYDFYCSFIEEERILEKNTPNLIPTGISTAFSKKFSLNLKSERSSVSKHGMNIVAGRVDSGYRGEVFVNIIPLVTDVVISKTYNFPIENGKQKAVNLGNVVYYPYSLAIAQGLFEIVPDLAPIEIPLEELKGMTSERGDGALGSSGK